MRHRLQHVLQPRGPQALRGLPNNQEGRTLVPRERVQLPTSFLEQRGQRPPASPSCFPRGRARNRPKPNKHSSPDSQGHPCPPTRHPGTGPHPSGSPRSQTHCHLQHPTHQHPQVVSQPCPCTQPHAGHTCPGSHLSTQYPSQPRTLPASEAARRCPPWPRTTRTRH